MSDSQLGGGAKNVHRYNYSSSGPVYWYDCALMGGAQPQRGYRVRVLTGTDMYGAQATVPIVDFPTAVQARSNSQPSLFTMDTDGGWTPLPGDPSGGQFYILQWFADQPTYACHRTICDPIPDSRTPPPGSTPISVPFTTRSYEDVELAGIPDLQQVGTGGVLKLKKISGTRNGSSVEFYVQEPYPQQLRYTPGW